MKSKIFVIVFAVVAIGLGLSGTGIFHGDRSDFISDEYYVDQDAKANKAANNTSQDQASSMSIIEPYAFESAPVSKNGAIFLTLQNNSDISRRVVSAHADVSNRIELHTHIMDGDIMMMREVEGYDIAAGAQTVLEPKGHHIMLIDLNAPLQAGESFPVTLTFENGETLDTIVQIRPFTL